MNWKLLAVLAATMITACRREPAAEDETTTITKTAGGEIKATDASTQLATPAPRSQVVMPSAQRVVTPALAWAGSSALGYIRAELWISESDVSESLRELRVIHPDGSIHKHRGRMIPIPRDFAPGGGPWSAFIADAPQRYASPYPAFLAAVNATGVLRLYEFGGPDGIAACDLQPVR